MNLITNTNLGKWLLAIAVPACLATGTSLAASAPPQYHELLDRYCVKCHNGIDNLPAGKPLYLDEVNLDDVEKDALIWELVVRKLGTGAMPPQGKPHPGAKELQEFRGWLIKSLDETAMAKNDPGKFRIHRLNRTEYANAIRDLVGLEVDVTSLLPPDGSDFGFDNVATGLQVTPALLERYLTAATRISALAVGDREAESAEVKFPLRLDYDQGRHIDGLPLGTRGGTVVRYNFPADGEYLLSGALYRPVDSADSGLEGQMVPTEFQILVDGVVVHSAQLGGPRDHIASRRNLTAVREEAAERMKVRTLVKAGAHDVGFTFVERAPRSQDVYKLSQRISQDIHVTGAARLTAASITGPFSIAGIARTQSRERLYVCQPESAADERACAKQILSTLARRAYRRPVTDKDMERVMAFYEEGRRQGDFDAGIRAALPRVLTSVSFLFRAEKDPDSLAVGAPHPVTDLELASRLSFFLWSTIPDDELLDVAASGKLRSKGMLERQVKRMLADDRARQLTTNFPDQWLALRNLANSAPDLLAFPNWDYSLRNDLQTETHLFFDSIVREDRSALDLLNADYTFLNERVAKHYGIPGIYGQAFRRVTLADPNRHGLLGQGSILALTSVATRTSPVFRGKWILTNLLNTPPLPPPPNVPSLEESTKGSGPKTVRERMEAHRADSVCASCHNIMDPLGFALENFDATGRWLNVSDTGGPIDASGVLVDGTEVNGPVALRAAFTSRPDVFVGTVTEKLLIYALGRGLEPTDMAVVRKIVRDAQPDNYRFMSLIMGIVESKPFQMRTKTGPEAVSAQAAKVKE
jgi:hypothetical protein